MENQESGPKGFLLADDPGLGKTIQLIATMLGNPKKNTLVVVPKSIITQWVGEINKFAPQLSVHVFDGPNRTLKEADVVIMPYSLLSTNETTVIHKKSWDRIILDEAHEIRNKKSKLFKSVCRLKSDIRGVVTGTPVFNSMEDFVSLCAFLGIDKALVQGMTSKIKDIYILRRTKDDLAKINERLRLPRLSL
jgi:SNF2 family DNA or RNA helicase